MSMVGNVILQQANNPGTGTFSLISAPAGRLSWVAQIGTGQQAFYFANDGASVEYGIGTVTASSPDTLSRDTVLGNSLGTTAKINFTGLVTLTNDVPGQRSIYASPANDAVPFAGRKLSGLAVGVAVDDAPRLDQLAWRDLGSFGIASGAISMALPVGYTSFRLSMRNMIVSSSTFLYFRLSTDGGASYHAAIADYTFQTSAQVGTNNTYTNYIQTSYFELTDTLVAGAAARCDLDFDTLANQVDSKCVYYGTGGGLGMGRYAGYSSVPGPFTNIVVAAAGAAILTSGNIRLEGRT